MSKFFLENDKSLLDLIKSIQIYNVRKMSFLSISLYRRIGILCDG